PEPARIKLRSKRMTALLGMSVPFTEASAILTRLGCSVQVAQAAGEDITAEVVAPLHRPDLTLEVNLIDEVVRVRGLDLVPSKLPAIQPQLPRTTGVIERRIRRIAIEVGLSEAITYAFVSPKEIAALGLPPSAVVLKNPLSEERSVMR